MAPPPGTRTDQRKSGAKVRGTFVAMGRGMNDMNGWRDRLAASAWARLGGKLSLYAIGFGALALIGSGRWLSWVPPARGDSLGVGVGVGVGVALGRA
jgi:hypothetical protein